MCRHRTPLWVALATFILLCHQLLLGHTKSDELRVERLAALGRLWATIAYFHPYLAYRVDIDWDAALLAAIPKVSGSDTTVEYGAAVQSMLTALDDSATKAIQESHVPSSSGQIRRTSYRVTADEIGIWAMGDHSNAPDVAAQQGNLNKAASDLSRLRGIIFDLRSQTPSRPFTRGFASFFLNTTQVAQRLSSESYMTPAERIRTPGAFRIGDSRRVEPGAGARDMPVVFIINDHSDLPAEMFGLQTAGRARIVAEGEVTGRAITATSDIPLSDGLVAQIRVGELVFEQGVRPFHPDVLVPKPEKPTDSDTALATAENLIRGFDSKALSRSYSPALGVARPDRPYADAPYSAPEVRLLAVFRLWGAINYLFPYRELITAQWDDVLKEAVQAVENADDAVSYHLAIAAMAAHIGDSHGIIQSSILDEHFGTAAPPVRVRMIERLPVITGFRDEQAARDAGAEIGHVILSVDGEPVNDRVIRYAKYVASSTPQALLRDVLDRRSSTASTGGILYGPPQSTVTLVVRDRAGQRKTIALARRTEFRAVREQRSGEILRLLPNGIGYADLDRLTTSMIDQMFEKFRGTKGIVFDMRGYPRIDQANLAARLTDQKSVPGAIFETVVRMLPDNKSDITGRSTTDVAIQTFSGASSEPYRGRTVLLIDERTQSAAEHLGLFLKAANNTVFVVLVAAGSAGLTHYMRECCESFLRARRSASAGKIAVRRALGASGRPLTRQTLMETALLAIAGTLARPQLQVAAGSRIVATAIK